MKKLFSLRNLCGFDITRPVCDMDAFFDYELADKVSTIEPVANVEQAVLSVSYAAENQEISAILRIENKSFASVQHCQAERGETPTGGELTRCIKLAVVAVLEQSTSSKPAMPWGILTGVRPDKLAHKLLDAGHSANAVICCAVAWKLSPT